MHNRPKSASLCIAGKRLMYRICDIGATVNIDAQKCNKCNGILAIVADTVQWGFYEDEYHYYTICQDCGKPTCFRQVVPNYEIAEGEREDA